MDRASALRILGLGPNAGPAEIEAAYWALRAHIEVRAEESHSEVFRAERAEELRVLDAALRLLQRSKVAPGEESRPRAGAPAWLWAWASTATLLVLVLAGLLLLGPDRSSDPGASSAEAVSGGADGRATAAARQDTDALLTDPSTIAATGRPYGAPAAPAELVAQATLEGTLLEVRDEQGETQVSAPADGRSHTLAPGRYVLHATHPDCPDAWVEEIELSPGERHEVLASTCTETGWVVVRSNVGGDRVLVDERSAGSTGPHRHRLSVGEHTVRVTKPGYKDWEGVVVVEPAELVTLRAELVPDENATQAARDADATSVAMASAGEDAPLRERDDSMLRASRGWHDSAMQWLLARYDLNLSRQLDTPQEIEAIPCTEWLGLERSFDASGLGLPLTRLYGFNGSGWVEGSLGVSTRMRDVAYLHMKRCGLR